jgi:Ca2+-binding EF-hand superfamily protein
MQFDVFVQGKLYKSLAAKNSGEVLAIVARDIKKSLVPGFDSSKSHDIKVVPKMVEDAFDNMDRDRDGRISRDEFKTK